MPCPPTWGTTANVPPPRGFERVCTGTGWGFNRGCQWFVDALTPAMCRFRPDGVGHKCVFCGYEFSWRQEVGTG